MRLICISAHHFQECMQEEQLVCTVGEVNVKPGASNVISGHTEFSVDIRAKVRPWVLPCETREQCVDECVGGRLAVESAYG